MDHAWMSFVQRLNKRAGFVIFLGISIAFLLFFSGPVNKAFAATEISQSVNTTGSGVPYIVSWRTPSGPAMSCTISVTDPSGVETVISNGPIFGDVSVTSSVIGSHTLSALCLFTDIFGPWSETATAIHTVTSNAYLLANRNSIPIAGDPVILSYNTGSYHNCQIAKNTTGTSWEGVGWPLDASPIVIAQFAPSSGAVTVNPLINTSYELWCFAGTSELGVPIVGGKFIQSQPVTITAPVATPPTITTNAATGITTSSATLNGTGNPNGTQTTGWFRYSATNPGSCNDTFGTRTPASGGTDLGSGSSAAPFNASASSLSSNTTYYFCAIGESAGGKRYGSVLSFTTNAIVTPPDLTASAVTPTTGTVGNQIIFNSSISTTGASTGSTFANVFQFSTNGLDSGAQAPIAGTSITGLNVGTPKTTTYNWTPLSAGPYYIRACADNTTSWGSAVAESNEDNNCGAWTPVTVSALVPGSYTLTVTKAGAAAAAGTVTSAPAGISCGADCSESYTSGQAVSLSATITNGSVTYSGACNGSSCSVTMTSAKDVTATFTCNALYTWNGSACVLPTPPDLTASAVTPTTGTVGNQIIFNSSISTTGASTGSTFANVFQFSTNGLDSGAQAPIAGTSITGLNVGTPKTTTYNWTPLSAGPYYIRACADNTTSWGSAVAESNEDNNCGAWTPVTVSAIAVSPPTMTTYAATAITTTGATLNGTGNPNGKDTTAWFRYSTTNPGACNDSFGTRVPAGGTGLGSGTGNQAYNAAISGLPASTAYYFCAIGTNTDGPGFGGVLTFTTSSVSQSNLTAASISGPISVAAGDSRQYRARISNMSAVGTGAFSNFLQISNSPDGGGPFVDGPIHAFSGGLPSDGYDDYAKSYTFDIQGTYSVRVCADKRNEADEWGVVTESNEGDNCGWPWTNVTVTAPAPPPPAPAPTATLLPSTATITSGRSSNLTWSSTNATTCTSPGFNTAGEPAGEISVGPLCTDWSSYTTCTGPGGNADSPIARVIVEQPSISITADPERVRLNSKSKIEWSADPTYKCSVSGPGLNVASTTSGSRNITITTQSKFSISCIVPTCSPIVKSVIVNLSEDFQHF